MDVFSHPEFDRHSDTAFFRDRASGLRAIVAIHWDGPGRAGGGCRMYPYASEADALRDALRLSRAMSYKLALADVPLGGGKAVIIGDPRTDKSESLLRAMGRVVESYRGRYVTAEDVGTTPADIEVMARETAHVVGRAGVSGDTSPPTAWGVFLGLRAAVKRRLGGDDLHGLQVAVQGVGNVGRYLCAHLAEAGARLVLTDLDGRALQEANTRHFAHAVAPERIYDQGVDVFAPCALGGVLNDETIPRLRCAVIAGGANNQLEAGRHDEMLAARGILYAPDYVINAGGAINASRELRGYDRADAYRAIEGIPDTLAAVFDRAETDGIPPGAAADAMARERIGRGADGRPPG